MVASEVTHAKSVSTFCEKHSLRIALRADAFLQQLSEKQREGDAAAFALALGGNGFGPMIEPLTLPRSF